MTERICYVILLRWGVSGRAVLAWGKLIAGRRCATTTRSRSWGEHWFG
jgi:hypothetical protein